MNKYQEALNRIKKEHIFIEDYLKKEIDLIQELVDKETPMKPSGDSWDDSWWKSYDRYCPKCKNPVYIPDDAYCNKCGQKLDWSDTND